MLVVGATDGKLNVGFGAPADAVVEDPLAPELAGVDEFRPPIKPAPPVVGSDPKRFSLLVVLPPPENSEGVAVGVCAVSAGLATPNSPPEDWLVVPPNKLLAGALDVASVGGGPAGVVEFIKLNFAGAGVVDPAGAVVMGLLVEPPPNKFPPACLFKLLLNIADVAGVDVVFWPLAGVDILSSFFCPKLKPPPNGELDAPAVPVIPPLEVDVVVAPAVFPKMLPPVVPLPPKRGVDVPEPGLDPAFPPPNKGDVWGAPVLAPNGLAVAGVLPLPPKRPPDAGLVVAVEF